MKSNRKRYICRRPMVLIGIVYVLGVLIGKYAVLKLENLIEVWNLISSRNPALLFFAIFLLLVAFARSFLIALKENPYKKILFIALVTILITSIFHSMTSFEKLNSVEKIKDKQLEILGVIKEISCNRNSAKIILKTIACENIKSKDKGIEACELLGYIKKDEKIKNYKNIFSKKAVNLERGDIVKCKMNISFLDKNKIIDEEYKKYLFSKGIGGVCDIKSIEKVKEDVIKNSYSDLEIALLKILRPVHKVSEKIKENFFKLIENKVDNFEIVEAILFGDKREILKETYEKFQKNGVAPILATSGFHLGIIFGVVRSVAGKKIRKTKSLIIVGIIVLYMDMCSFSLSIMRSGIMIFIGIIIRHYNMSWDMISAGLVAMIIQLYYCPAFITAVDFQLSYLAIFLIGVMNNIFNILFREALKNTVLKIFLVPFLLQSLMMPITAYYFNYFSLSGYIANVILTAIGSFIVVVGIGICTLAGFMSFLAILKNIFILEMIRKFLMGISGKSGDIFSFLLDKFLTMFIEANDITFFDGTMVKNMRSPNFIWLIFFYLLIFYLLSEKFILEIIRSKENKKGLFRWVAVNLTGILCLSFVTCILYNGFIFKKDTIIGKYEKDIWMITPTNSSSLVFVMKSDHPLKDMSQLEHMKRFVLKNSCGKVEKGIMIGKCEEKGVFIKFLIKELGIKNFSVEKLSNNMIKKIKKEYNIRYGSLNKLKQHEIVYFKKKIYNFNREIQEK